MRFSLPIHTSKRGSGLFVDACGLSDLVVGYVENVGVQFVVVLHCFPRNGVASFAHVKKTAERKYQVADTTVGGIDQDFFNLAQVFVSAAYHLGADDVGCPRRKRCSRRSGRAGNDQLQIAGRSGIVQRALFDSMCSHILNRHNRAAYRKKSQNNVGHDAARQR